MADQRLTQLTTTTTLANADLFYVVTGVSGTNGTSHSLDFQTLKANIPTGSGGLSLIEKKIITTNSTTISFSTGIAGNTDAEYILRGKIINNSGGTCAYVIRPNAATTNLKSGQNSSSTAGNFAGSTTTLRFANLSNAGVIGFNLNIHAQKNANSVGSGLAFEGTASGLDGSSNGAAYISGGAWSETATEMTSLDVVAETTNGIGSGSYLCLYKLPQA